MKRKRRSHKYRSDAEIVEVLRLLFHEPEFDRTHLPADFGDQWNPRLDKMAAESTEALAATFKRGKTEAKDRETARSKELWDELCNQYPALSCLGTPTVTLTEEGGLETQRGCYYYGGRHDLEEEFELRCTIEFAIDGDESHVYMKVEACLDTDAGSTKVYFSDPHVTMTAGIDFVTLREEHHLDMMEVNRAILALFEKELRAEGEFFEEIKRKLTKRFRKLAEEKESVQNKKTG